MTGILFGVPSGAKQHLEQPPAGSEQVLVVGRPEGGVTGLKVRGYLGIEVGHALFRTTAPLSGEEHQEGQLAKDGGSTANDDGVEEGEDEDEEEEEEQELLGSTACWVQLRDDESRSTTLDMTKRKWVLGRLLLVSWDEMRLVSYRPGTNIPAVELELERLLPVDI